MSNLATEIGTRIRNYRIQQGLSQEDLAEKSKLHPTYIGQVERGEKNPTIESISKISSGLGVPMSKLFENIDGLNTSEENYPTQAYNIVHAYPVKTQKTIVSILKNITNLL